MFGGGALTEAFTSKLSEGGTIGALNPNKLFPKLKDPLGGGGGCRGLGPPSKKIFYCRQSRWFSTRITKKI